MTRRPGRPSSRQPILLSHPEIAAQAVDEATRSLTSGSNKRVAWRCSDGHEWVVSPYERTSGRGCPYCSGRLAIPGQTDLATLHPALASELVNADPTTVRPMSHQILVWRCREGHEWDAAVGNRVGRGSGCPVCSGRQPISGVNDLATMHPAIAAQAIDTDPSTLTPHSDRRIEWQCSDGHRWKTAVKNRVRVNSGCPYCAGKLPIVGKTDLATLHPDIAAQAVDVDPRTLMKASRARVLWRCGACADTWRASVADRTAKGSGCPGCSTSGYKPGRPGHLYLLARTKEGREQRKVGITNTPSVRLARLRRLGWSLLDITDAMDGAVARSVERQFLAHLDAQGVARPITGARGDSGFTETWVYTDYPIDSIQEVLATVDRSN